MITEQALGTGAETSTRWFCGTEVGIYDHSDSSQWA